MQRLFFWISFVWLHSFSLSFISILLSLPSLSPRALAEWCRSSSTSSGAACPRCLHFQFKQVHCRTHTHTHVPTPACVWAFCYSDVESNPKLLTFCSRRPLYKTCRVTLFQAAQSAVGEDLPLLKYYADFWRESWHIQSYILNSGMNDPSLWASSFECVSPWLHI